MAYNYRPRKQADITKMKLPSTKAKVVLQLFKDMKANYGASYEEFITIETGSSGFGNVKILDDFKQLLDIEVYKKKYPGIALKFGNGSRPTSNAPTTQQQELCTLAIFEELLSSSTQNYTNFEQMLPTLMKIYPGITEEKSWYNSFALQFKKISAITKLPNNNFDVFNRDGGFMDWITKLVNSKFEIAKKDSWNPADIWLLKSSTYDKYQKKLNDAQTIQEVNAILVTAYNKYDIVGVSLKKNNGKNLNYDLVNLKSNAKEEEVEFLGFDLNIPFDTNTNKFTSVTSKLSVKYHGGTYSMGIKSNQASIGNITYEFVGSGAAAFLGKVPKDMLKLELSTDNQKMPEHSHFMKFDKKDFESKLKVIKSNKTIFNINGDLNKFVSNLEKSWDTNGRAKDNVVISQIFTFAYIIAKMTAKRRKEFIRDLFFMAQKKGPKFGPFGKLY